MVSEHAAPALYLFNPGCELDFTRAPRRARRAATMIRRELETLPIFLAGPDDLVAMERMPSDEFLDRIAQVGFPLPRFTNVSWTESGPRFEQPLPDSIADLHPWGWTPQSHAWLEPLFPRLPERALALAHPWAESRATIHRKRWSAEVAREFLQPRAEPWLINPEDLGRIAKDPTTLSELCRAGRARGHEFMVIKGTFGLSGRDAIRSFEPDLNPAQQRWVEKMLGRDGELLVEPWHDARADLSMRMSVSSTGHARVESLGRSLTDGRGQYRGGWATSLERALLDDPTLNFGSRRFEPSDLTRLMGELAEFLGPRLARAGHVGPVGVDALIYYDSRVGESRLHPLLEINPRTTMGHVVAALGERVDPSCVGLWLVVGREELGVLGFQDPTNFVESLACALPLDHDAARGIRSGTLPTSDLTHPGQTLGLLMVGESVSKLRALLEERGLALDSPAVGHAGRRPTGPPPMLESLHGGL